MSKTRLEQGIIKFRNAMKLILCLLIGLMFILSSCVRDQPNAEHGVLRIRIKTDPQRLNPILTSSSTSGQLEARIFQALSDRNPQTDALVPVLLESLPSLQQQDSSYFFDFKLRKGAQWSDGMPVTSADVLFSHKLIFLPDLPTQRYRFNQAPIASFELMDSLNYRLHLAQTKPDVLEFVSSFYIYPVHVYDPEKSLESIALESLISRDLSLVEMGICKQFAEQFQSEKYTVETVVGSGPYELNMWNPDFQIVLKKRKDWWGNEIKSNIWFETKVDTLSYHVIPDDQAAIQALKSNNIDVIDNIPVQQFQAMLKDSLDVHTYHTPSNRYVYLAVNQASELLEDVNMRKAIRNCLDVQTVIDLLMDGYGKPISSFIYPNSDRYNTDVPLNNFDLAAARHEIQAAGWSDSNGNGIVDKVIKGKRVEFQPELVITSSSKSKRLAAYMEEQMKKVGMGLRIVNASSSEMRKRISEGAFDLLALVRSQAPLEEEVYGEWHSDNLGESNFSSLRDPVVDSLIDAIRGSQDKKDRATLYRQLHAVLNDQVAAIYLFEMEQLLATRKPWQAELSNYAPGYLEQLFYQD